MVIMVLKTIPHKYPYDWDYVSEHIDYLKHKNRLGSIQKGKNGDLFYNVFEVDCYFLIKLSRNWNTIWRNIISGTLNLEIISYPECGYIIIL